MFSLGALGAQVSIVPEADTFVADLEGEALRSQNFGGSGGLAVAALGSPKGEMETILRFNLETLRADLEEQLGSDQWNVEAVQFKFNLTAARNPVFNTVTAGTLCVSEFADNSWVEGMGRTSFPDESGISFSEFAPLREATAESEPLACFDFGGESNGGVIVPIEPTQEFRDALLRQPQLSLRLAFTSETGALVLNSREIGMAARRPVLEVTASVATAPDGANLLSIAPIENGKIELRWHSTESEPETLQVSADLTAGQWEDLALVPVRDNDSWSAVIDVEKSNHTRFYRIAPAGPDN